MKFINLLPRLNAFSLNVVILFAISVLLLLATDTHTAFNFLHSKERLFELNTEKSLGIAITYSEILNGDSIELDFKRREKNADYNHWKTIGDNVLKRNELKYLYVMNINHTDSIEYYISAKDHLGQIDFLEKDHVDEFGADAIEKLRTGEQSITINHTEKYGWLVSSEVPVKNSKGEIVAFVGVDKDMGEVESNIKEMGFKLIAISFLFMAIVFFITLFIVKKVFISPIAKMVKAADSFNMLNTSFEDLSFTRIEEYNFLIESFIRMEKKIKAAMKRSFTDDLTKLNNRYFFMLSLDNILKPAEQEKKIAFMILDIDYFKQINDTYGHEKGDFVLRSVGVVLHSAFEDSQGVVARLGGDEFAICLEHVSGKQAIEDKCKFLKEHLSQIKCSEKEHGICASVGTVITSIGETPVSYSDIFSAADTALYEVKAEGRNSYRIVEI